jgi:hypothetical protein
MFNIKGYSDNPGAKQYRKRLTKILTAGKEGDSSFSADIHFE